MKGKIDEKGLLLIERAGIMIPTSCRFAVYSTDPMNCPVENGIRFNVFSGCGEDCPLFGEPIIRLRDNTNVTELSICQGKTLEFERFVDEREGRAK